MEGRAPRAGLSRGMYGLSVLQSPLVSDLREAPPVEFIVTRSPWFLATAETRDAESLFEISGRRSFPNAYHVPKDPADADGRDSCRPNSERGIRADSCRHHQES